MRKAFPKAPKIPGLGRFRKGRTDDANAAAERAAGKPTNSAGPTAAPKSAAVATGAEPAAAADPSVSSEYSQDETYDEDDLEGSESILDEDVTSYDYEDEDLASTYDSQEPEYEDEDGESYDDDYTEQSGTVDDYPYDEYYEEDDPSVASSAQADAPDEYVEDEMVDGPEGDEHEADDPGYDEPEYDEPEYDEPEYDEEDFDGLEEDAYEDDDARSDETIPAGNRAAGAAGAAGAAAAAAGAAPRAAPAPATSAPAAARKHQRRPFRLLQASGEAPADTSEPAARAPQRQQGRGFFTRLQKLGQRRRGAASGKGAAPAPAAAAAAPAAAPAAAELQRRPSERAPQTAERKTELRRDANTALYGDEEEEEEEAGSVSLETSEPATGADPYEEEAAASTDGRAPPAAPAPAAAAPAEKTAAKPAAAARKPRPAPPAASPLPQTGPYEYDEGSDYTSTNASAANRPAKAAAAPARGPEPVDTAGESARDTPEDSAPTPRGAPEEILLHDGAKGRMPEIVDPFQRQIAASRLARSGGGTYPARPESIQPSVLEADSMSGPHPSSPLLPSSGPLSGQRSSTDERSSSASRDVRGQLAPAPAIAQTGAKPEEAAGKPVRQGSRRSATSGVSEYQNANGLPLTSEALQSLARSKSAAATPPPVQTRTTRHTPNASQSTAEFYSPGQGSAASPVRSAGRRRSRKPMSDLSQAERERLGGKHAEKVLAPRDAEESVPPVPPVPAPAAAPPPPPQDFHGLEFKTPHPKRSQRPLRSREAEVPAAASNFLLTPSMAPSESDVGEEQAAAEAAAAEVDRSWLVQDISPEQTHYLVRELVGEELDWEMDRLWMLTSFDRPPAPERRRAKQALVDDRGDDFISVDEREPPEEEDEDAVFRRDVYEPVATPPDLPLMRFLLKNAYSTFPLFVPPERRQGKPTPNKAAIARSYFFNAIMPLLREFQARSLSAAVDRHGESDGSPFSALSTSRAVFGLLRKWTTRYVTAVLRVGAGDPYLGSTEVHKRPWTWPPATLMPPEAYVSYRRPTDRLRFGGLEVDIVAVRAPSSGERDFVLRIRRPNRADEFVVRNDTDFEEFQANLSQELGPFVHVRALPRLPGKEHLRSRAPPSSTTEETRSGATGTLSTGYGTETLDTYDDEYDDEETLSTETESTRGPVLARGRARPTPQFEVDRRLLRSWLRDTLAIRSIHESQEVRAFLGIGSFSDRDLGTDDLLNIAERRRIDCRRIEERETDAELAGENVLGIRRVLQRIWLDCVDGDGFLKAYDALKATPDFWDLPTSYQSVISWGNLQAARFLYGVFVQGDESRANLARARDLYDTIPWRKLANAMRLPALQMVHEWERQFLRNRFLQSVLQIVFEDDPNAMDEDLRHLQRAIGSDTMLKKLRAFVESPDHVKRLVRRHARTAGIPLVAAIVRGSDAPKLARHEVQRVILATQSYNAFMSTQPNAAKKRANTEPGYLLITNLQRVLRLYSLHRDATQVRGMLQDPTILDALTVLFEPLTDALARLHCVQGIRADLLDLRAYLGRLLDLLESLRARIQDPARSINMIASFLDRGSPHLYNFLHRWSAVDPVVFSSFAWLRHLAMTVGAGSEDLTQLWDLPLEHGLSGEHHLDGAMLHDVQELADAARRKRNRQMEIACRWSAGDTEGDFSIQVFGDGTGRMRQEPFLPKEPRAAPAPTAVERLLRSFREAVSGALAR